jgi:DNA-binding transcriptional ArsR family regulator
MSATFNLDLAFSALADPTRRAILAGPAQGETTVRELAKPFEMTQPAVSRHLKGLEDAGLVACRVDGTRPPRSSGYAGYGSKGLVARNVAKSAEEELRPAGRGSRRRGTTGVEQPKIRR